MRNVLFDMVLIGLIVFCVGWYVLYRNSAANKLTHFESFTILKSAPATVCTVQKGDFQSSSTGVLYVHRGIALFNVMIEGSVQGFRGRLHVFVQSNGVHYIYPETSDLMSPRLDLQQRVALVDEIIFSYRWDCSPWWIPDDSIFKLPK